MKRILAMTLLAASGALAGPPLACFHYDAAPGSLFASIERLAEVVLDSDTRPEASRKTMEALRAAARPDNFQSLVEAGFVIQAMNQMWGKQDPDGLRFLNMAAKLQPKNAELRLLLTLGNMGGDRNEVTQNLKVTRALAPAGSLVSRNLAKAVERFPELGR